MPTTHQPVAGISDIVPRRADSDKDDRADSDGKKRKGVKLTIPEEEGGEADEGENDAGTGEEEETAADEAENSFFGGKRFFTKRTVPAEADDDRLESSRGISGRAVAWTVGVIVVLAVAFYVTTAVLGHAQVAINFTQTPWNYQNDFVADKSISAPNDTGSSVSIPAQVFTAQKNVTQLFPATGKNGSVSVKAKGIIAIYNDYGPASQELVATTRFETPDGKIFRITSNVTIPGAKVAANGAITPSSITAPIVADQGGPDYNVGPVSKLTIPGFASNPGKYAGFYGSIASGTSGGFVGIRAVPTVADIAAAKASTTAILQADLQSGLVSTYPNNFKILDGATQVAVSKLMVSTTTDANGNFSVFGEASLTAIGFDESALKSYLLSLANNAGGSTPAFKTVNLSYADVQANFSKGQVSFALSGTGAIEPAFSADQFASSIAGKSIGEARDSVQNLPSLSNGKISVWPIWLWKMPTDPNKIQVTAN